MYVHVRHTTQLNSNKSEHFFLSHNLIRSTPNPDNPNAYTRRASFVVNIQSCLIRVRVFVCVSVWGQKRTIFPKIVPSCDILENYSLFNIMYNTQYSLQYV